jgi:hypothetical protein
VGKPRLALLHTWQWTQTEGWWRQRLDWLKVPYEYISTQDVAADANLRTIVQGLPMWGAPIPWKQTAETPNLCRIDSTDDMRPGLGFAGLEHLRDFVARGGTLVAAEDTAQLVIDQGMAPGVRVANHGGVNVVGSVLQARFPDPSSPIADGIGDALAVYSAEGMSFEISDAAAGGWPQSESDRATGRGGPKDSDFTVGRPAPPSLPEQAKSERWEARPLGLEESRHNPWVIPVGQRPKTLLRFGDADELLLSGLLEHGGELARRAAVVSAHYGQGRVVLFAINPIWRGETIGSHALVWNAVLAGAGLQ